jgi:hypothetical protein
MHEDFENYPPHADDAILLVKQYISSCQLSQPPLLVFPVHLLEILGKQPLEPIDRNKMTDRELKEYRKTARVIEGPHCRHKCMGYILPLLLNLTCSIHDQRCFLLS